MYYELSDTDLTHFAREREGTGFLINLIDSPYPVDHSNGIVTNMCVTDGAVITVDCSPGEFLTSRPRKWCAYYCLTCSTSGM